MKWLVVLGLLAWGPAHGDQELEQYLREFDANPAKVMNQRLPKRDVRTGKVTPVKSLFSAEDIRSGKYIQNRDWYRQQMCTERGGLEVCLSQVEPGRAPFRADDRVEDLIDNSRRVIRTLEEMESRNLKSAELSETPWSDDYWPLYQGALAARYADDRFPRAKDWKVNKEYVEKFNLDILLKNPVNSSSVDRISPAEKYDLLIGDDSGTFTRVMWEQGAEYFHSYGKVEDWMGLCHGWAAAAYMLPRPTRAITLLAADGVTKIRFFPSDIKALATSLWASANTPTRFVGGRCNSKNPKKDSSGRVIDQQCFDTNPGTWHMAVVNQIGVAKRSFVLDATYDYEVWNHPVYSYKYTYFNPQTGKTTHGLEEARIPMEAYGKDKFKKYRSPQARYVVGVSMHVNYVIETDANARLTDSPQHDALKSVRYVYDLELDGRGEIIGGEWYTNLHPDFLWTPPPGVQARSVGDAHARGDWDGRSTVPREWRGAAIRAAEYGQPLGKIVETMIILSRM